MLKNNRLSSLGLILIGIVSLILHWNIFHLDIRGNHSIRQAQTQINILNFYRYDQNILNPRANVLDRNLEPSIRRFEFPVMQWMIAICYYITGESILVTRVIMFLIGMTAVWGMYRLLNLLFNDRLVSLAGAWAFSFSPVFYFYTLNPLPDILALSAAIWSLVFFFKFLTSGQTTYILFNAFFISLAAAAKLPYIIFIAAPGIWWLTLLIIKKNLRLPKAIAIALGYLAILSPTVFWYAKAIPTWTNGLAGGIFTEDISWDLVREYMDYHVTIMFPEILLGYIAVGLFIFGIVFFIKFNLWKNSKFLYLFVTALAVLFYWIYEFSRIGVVHDYYMMPFLPILYLVVAGGIFLLFKHKTGKILATVLLISMPVSTVFISKEYWKIQPHWALGDAFLFQDDLKNAVPNEAICIFVNDPYEHVFMYLADKKGFVFWNDHLPAMWVEDMIRNYGVTHMYSDSRIVDTDPEVIPYLDELLIERGKVRVFKLGAPD